VTIPAALINRLREAKHVVVFTGAGVSAESGIPTFRDAMTGLWERFDAHQLATPEAFHGNPSLVWGWYEWRRMRVMLANSNPAHQAIAALATKVPRLTVITQNVDDLHERAGSIHVLHLHGSLFQPRCIDCEQPHHFSDEIPDEPEGGRYLDPPRCDHCGGLIRPGVVWFGEAMPAGPWDGAINAVSRDGCDVFFSIGTSSLVYPAAELPFEAARRGATVVQINPTPTQLDSIATYNLTGAAGMVLPDLLQQAFWISPDS
jgi:NAD-dependent deacetylase